MMQRNLARRRALTVLAAGLLAAVGPGTLAAQAFPSKAVRFVVPFPPGSGTDTSARYFGTKFTEITGQPVVVENRPGANGFIAVRDVLNAPADGYTVFVGSNSTLAVNAALFKDLPYDPQKDLAPLTMMMRAPTVLVVPPQSAYESVADLVEAARAAPGDLDYAAGSAGYQLMAELFNETAGVRTEHVPFKGASEALMAVASGTVDFTVSDITAAYELVNGGRLRGLAVAAEDRASALPALPAAGEAGLEGFHAYVWVGAMVSAQTPAAETEKLAEVLTQIARMPETKTFYERIGAEVMEGGAEEMRAFQAEEIELWHRIVDKAGIPRQ